MNAYLRGVSLPSHRYIDLAETALNPDEPSKTLDLMRHSTRAYTRLIFRLRAQAELEQLHFEQQALSSGAGPPTTFPRPSHMGFSESDHGHGGFPSRPPSRARNGRRDALSPAASYAQNTSFGASSRGTYRFRSPLFKIGHAPLLRVFVPSVEGQWLSDADVVECEKELKRAGVLSLLKVGDVVWDIAVGDEGNIGEWLFSPSCFERKV